MTSQGKPSPDDVVFVCTKEDCDAGPWKSRNDAMAHVVEKDGEHAFTGRNLEDVDAEPEDVVIPEGSGLPTWNADEDSEKSWLEYFKEEHDRD